MGTYGLLQDDSEEGDSFDNIPQHQNTRKRTYPVAFPAEEPAEIYPYNTSVPVAIDKESPEGVRPFGLTMSSILDCFSTAFSWIGHIGVEIFTTGILYSLRIRKLITVGSWVQKHRTTTGYDGQPIPKRQRVLPQQSQQQPEHDETSPLIARQPPVRKPPSPIPRTPPKHTQILPESNSLQNDFLSGQPFIENRGSYLPSVPRSKRFPQPSRAQRLTKLTSHLRKDSHPHQQSIPGGALRKSHISRPGPYDRHVPPQKRQQEAESRLSALEKHVNQLRQGPNKSDSSALPTFSWGDEEVTAEFRRHYRRPSQWSPPQPVPHPPTISRDPATAVKFNFKFSTPMPSKFEFGGQFTSPPRSGVPREIIGEPVSGVEKAQFRFELPPTEERERLTPRPVWDHTPSGNKGGGGMEGSTVKREGNGGGNMFGMKASQSMPAISSHLMQSTEIRMKPQVPGNRQTKRKYDPEQENKNTFTIFAQEGSKGKSSLIQKSLPAKSHSMSFQITSQAKQPPQPPQESQPHSFPLPSQSIPSPPPSATGTPIPGHRRTKSFNTPTRSSRRFRITPTYAQDSHREFIRELRERLGQKKAKEEQEEREIEEQIRKLREEGQAVESTLAGEIPRLPELLARKVLP